MIDDDFVKRSQDMSNTMDINIPECEKIYGKFIKEDENYCYFEGKGPHGVSVIKNFYIKIK